jgi:phosphoglycerol transferase
MNKKKLYKKTAVFFLKLILTALVTFFFLLFFSLRWLNTAWGDVSIATAVFQLSTPLAGTDPSTIQEYIVSCVVPTVIIMFFTLILSLFVIPAIMNCGYSFSVRLFRLRLHFDGHIYKKIVTLPTVIISVILMLSSPGLFDYLKSLTVSTKIYDEYYIEPSDDLMSFPEKKRNLLLVYLESMESTYASVEVGGGKPKNLIPGLYELSQENVSFSNTEKFGGAISAEGADWTMGAILASSSGIPYAIPVERNSMSDYTEFLPGLTNMGDVLKEHGYANYFACGSNAAFGGRRLYFEKHGDYTIHDYYYAVITAKITPPHYDNGFWGMEDSYLFKMAKEDLTKLGQSDQPFNYTMLTVDTHNPNGYVCPLCDKDGESDPTLATPIRCSDRQTTEFLKWVQEQDWYKDTTVVVIGDHCSMNATFWKDLPEGYDRRVYNCFMNVPVDVNRERTVNREFSSIDYFPTILAALNVDIKGNKLGLGTNLFSDEKTLTETIGIDKYNEEVIQRSDFYATHFIEKR